MTAPAVEVDVDSTAQQAADQAPSSRRRVAQPSMGRTERARLVDLEIGGYAYDARCPKLVVWTDMASLIEEQRGTRRERRRAGDRAPAEDTRVTSDRIRLTQAVTHFLRGCLSAADWSEIERDLADPDNDLDLPDLWGAGMRLIVEFQPDMQDMAKKIGMRIPTVLEELAERIGPDGSITDAEPAPAKPARKAPAKRAAKAPGRKPR